MNEQENKDLVEENRKLKEFIKLLKDARVSYSLYSRQVLENKIWEAIDKEIKL